MTRRSVIVALAGLLVVSSLGGLVIAQQGTPDAGGDLTLAELKDDGKHHGVTGARIVPGQEQVFYLEHIPANQPWKSVSSESNGPKFGSGQTLQTNTLYLRTIRTDPEPQTLNVTIAFWDRGSRMVEDGNVTREEAVAANVTTTTQTVTLGQGWAVTPIDFPKHDSEVRATMWIEEYPDSARWVFSHKSVAFTQPIGVGTWSEFVVLAAGFVIVPALAFGAYGGRKVRSWVDRAGAPPGHGFLYYFLAATILAGLSLYGLYAFVAELIVAAPIVLGLYVGVVYVGYMLATHEGNTSRKLFWQPHIESVEAFAKTKIPSIGADADAEEGDGNTVSFSEDMPFGTMRSYRILDEGQDGLSIVRDGWLAFLARLKGGRAKIENVDELRTRFQLWNSGWDEVFIVDPDADQLIEYEPPGLSLKTPEIDDWTDLVRPALILGGLGLVAWQATQQYGAIAWTTLLVAVPWLVWKFAVTGTDTYARVEPAPAAMRSVLASMLVLQTGHRDAAKLEEAEEFAWRALAQDEEANLSWERRRDETFVDATFGTGEDGETKPDPLGPRPSDAGSHPAATDGGDPDE
ncbi:hypothetical protein [Halorhabdus sp. CUG00001]|uniref:hypothetical protein n=1 Tax=Halorhabdus sp. CUG00001 TaxID=2600297 RepID=UPI00131DD98F|nr:hypothetical protein [Halorhabdus sp. CUG00001]